MHRYRIRKCTDTGLENAQIQDQKMQRCRIRKCKNTELLSQKMQRYRIRKCKDTGLENAKMQDQKMQKYRIRKCKDAGLENAKIYFKNKNWSLVIPVFKLSTPPLGVASSFGVRPKILPARIYQQLKGLLCQPTKTCSGFYLTRFRN